MALGDKNIILGDKDFEELKKDNKKKNISATAWLKYVPFLGKDKKKENEKEQQEDKLMVVGKDFDKKRPIYISEKNYGQFRFPHCCHPIPGDDILGYIDNNNRIEIHKRACPVAGKLKTSFGNRIIDAKWDMHRQMLFDATIEIRGIDRRGMLKDVAEVLSDKLNINIRKITITSEDGIFDGSIDIQVYDRDDVKQIIDTLKTISDLQEVMQIM